MTTIGLILCFTFLVLIRNVYSQGVESPDDREIRACDANSRCVTARRCSAGSGGGRIPDRPVCGYTRGERQRPKICCSVLPEVPNGPTINTAGCGFPRDAPDSGFVKGGKRAKPGAFPWMVAIQMANKYGRQAPWCTGFLITRRHVLSAAHCFEDPQASLYELRIGNVDLRKGRTYTIQTIKVHKGYRVGTNYDDIALLTLTREADEPDVNVICLPFGRLTRKNLTGLGTTVAGWGAEDHGGLMSNHLLFLEGMPVIANRECNRIFNNKLRGFSRQFTKGVTPGLMCAGYLEGGKDSCGGDSGGPLMILRTSRWYAVGIVSFGHECGAPGFPGGYTRVSHYLDWIQRNL